MILVGWDTESPSYGDDSLDRIPAPPLACASVYDETEATLLDRREGPAWFRWALTQPDQHLIACNLPHDLGVMVAADPSLMPLVWAALDAGRLHDVAIREALIDIAKGELIERGEGDDVQGFRYGLALLVDRYLKIDISADKEGDTWRLRYGELIDVPLDRWPWKARRYPLRDAVWPVEVFRAQEATGSPNLHDEGAQVAAAFALHLMRLRGLRTDRAAVEEFERKVEAEWGSARAELAVARIFRPDGTKDMKHLRALVTAAYGGEPPKTPKGEVSTDRDTLAESGDPVLEKLGTTGKNDKRRTTYLPILKQGIDAPWHSDFNVLVGTTRVSSNAQQFPSSGGVRECFRARPGYCFCSVDYGGLELRTMSQRAIWDPDIGYSLMAESLNAGKDVHTMAAATFLGTTYEELLPRVKAKEDVATKFRDLAKVFNFGKGGGMGDGAMVYTARKGAKGETTVGPDGRVYAGTRFCILAGAATVCGERKRETRVQGKARLVCVACIEVSRQLSDGWLRAWPEQGDLFRKAKFLTPRGVFIDVEIPGPPGIPPIIRGACGYTQWLNTPFQGLGARLVKDAMTRISAEMYTDPRSLMWGSFQELNVHDELVAEMPLDPAPEAAERMALLMRETAAQWLPDLGPSIEAEPAIGLILSKKMATLRERNDPAGRLRLWHPGCKCKPREPLCEVCAGAAKKAA